jgi:hypothetical protein
VVDEPRQTEVTELGVEGLVQHDVARFDVAVDDALIPFLVEVQYGGRQSKNYLVPEKNSDLR